MCIERQEWLVSEEEAVRILREMFVLMWLQMRAGMRDSGAQLPF